MKDAKSLIRKAILFVSSIFILDIVIRFIDLIKIVRYFPLDFINDLASYMGQLYFLAVCGYHSYCPYWYNGFTTFIVTPPGWYFFALPWYYLTKSVTAAFVLSVAAMLIIACASIMFFGKRLGWSKLKSFSFFAILFGNTLSLGAFLRLGRVHAMLDFVLLIVLFFIIWSYRTKKIDFLFFSSSIVYSMMLVTHYQETILAGLFFLGLFLYKENAKEKLAVMLSLVIGIVLSLWWTAGFVRGVASSVLPTLYEGMRVLEFTKDVIVTNLLTIIVPAILFCAVYICWLKRKISNRDLLFMAPSIVMGMMLMVRLNIIIPVVKNISQDPYIVFFLLQALFFLFLVMDDLPRKTTQWLVAALVLISSISFIVNITTVPFFREYSELDKEMFAVFDKINDRYIIIGGKYSNLEISYTRGYYSYGSIYYNLSTADGWSDPIADPQYVSSLAKIYNDHPKLSCDELKARLSSLNITEVVAYDPACQKLGGCGFSNVSRTEHICLYDIKVAGSSVPQKL